MKTPAMLALAAGTALPRAIAASGIRADAADPKVLIEQINAAVKEMRDKNDERLGKIEAKVDPLDIEQIGKISAAVDTLEKAMDEQARKIAAAQLNGPGEKAPKDPEYTKAFQAHLRKGDVNAALSVGSAPDGGYLAPTEWDRTITDRMKLISPMRQHATVEQTGTAGFIRLYNNRNVGSGWVGETAARPETSTPQLQPLIFANGEIYANPMATQQLLDDSVIDAEAWLQREVETEFDRQEGIAYLSGNGTNKPRGLLTYATGGTAAAVHPWGAIEVVNSGDAAKFTSDGIVNLTVALPSMYSGNAKFFASRGSFGKLRLLKDGQGNYIWQPTFTAGQPATLAGYPLVEMPDMPVVAAGALALAFGDMAATYLILDRVGVSVLRDPYTNKPFVGFYTTKRVGGGVQNPDAMKLQAIAA